MWFFIFAGTSVEAYAHANKSTDSSITEDHLADPVASDTGEQSPKSVCRLEAKISVNICDVCNLHYH